MSSSSRKVRTSGPDRVTGTILRGQSASVAYPKDSDGAGAFAFSTTNYWDLGFISDGGVTKSEAITVSKIKEFGGKTVARFQNEYNASFALSLLEYNENVAKCLYGAANVTVIPADGDHGEIIVAKAGNSPQVSVPWMIRMVGRNNQRTLYSIPLGMVTTTGDVTHVPTAAAAQPITIETLPDDDGYDFYMFDDDGNIGAVTAVPTLTSALPSGKGTGQTVLIKGTRFKAAGVDIVTGAAGVKFGATNAADYYVVDANTIAAVLPSGSAGSVNITVTNTTGTSSALAYTRAA